MTKNRHASELFPAGRFSFLNHYPKHILKKENCVGIAFVWWRRSIDERILRKSKFHFIIDYTRNAIRQKYQIHSLIVCKAATCFTQQLKLSKHAIARLCACGRVSVCKTGCRLLFRKKIVLCLCCFICSWRDKMTVKSFAASSVRTVWRTWSMFKILLLSFTLRIAKRILKKTVSCKGF